MVSAVICAGFSGSLRLQRARYRHPSATAAQSFRSNRNDAKSTLSASDAACARADVDWGGQLSTLQAQGATPVTGLHFCLLLCSSL